VDGDSCALVEVKRRTCGREFARALRHLGAEEQTRPLGFEPSLFKVVEDAHDQLRQHDPMHQRLWIVWRNVDMHAGGDMGLQTVVGPLYGVKEAILPAEIGDGACCAPELRPCKPRSVMAISPCIVALTGLPQN
jgi:hypothetical protein